MTDLRNAAPGLMSALYDLADAGPDVSAVEALTAETHRKRPSAGKDAMTANETIPADCLAGRHLGYRVRVAVLSGAVVEDTLTSISADNPKAARIFLTFEHVSPVAPRLTPNAAPVFAVMPDTEVTVFGGSK